MLEEVHENCGELFDGLDAVLEHVSGHGWRKSIHHIREHLLDRIGVVNMVSSI